MLIEVDKQQFNKQVPKICPKCGGKVLYFSGINKEGKEYHFYGCVQRKTCGWIYKGSENKNKIENTKHEELMNAIRKTYAKLLEIEKEIKEISNKLFGNK